MLLDMTVESDVNHFHHLASWASQLPNISVYPLATCQNNLIMLQKKPGTLEAGTNKIVLKTKAVLFFFK